MAKAKFPDSKTESNPRSGGISEPSSFIVF